MKRLIPLLLILTACSNSALAITLEWTEPKYRVDGTPLYAPTDIGEYRLYCGTLPAYKVPAGNQYTAPLHDILPAFGEYICYLTAVDMEGLESLPSNTVTLNYDRTAPQAPTLTIKVN